MADAQSKRKSSPKQAAKDCTFIYSLSHPETGEARYVGQTCRSIEYRLYEHIRSAKSGAKWPVSNWIRKLIQADMEPIAALLEIIPPGGDWQSAETRHISLLREAIGGRALNATDGGDGTRGHKLSDETRARISAIAIAQGRKPVGNLGRVFSAEARANMAAAHVGKSFKQSPEARARRFGPCPSRKWTPEHRAKLMASRSLYETTEEHKKSLSVAGKIAWEKRNRVEGQGALPFG